MGKDKEKEIATAIENISKLNIVNVYSSTRKLLWYNFLIGISRGLGTVFGATIVLALIIYILSKIQWIPYIGDFVEQVLQYLDSA